jgi:hypothetical protein
MIKHVYKIKFNKSSFDLNEDYKRLAEYEKESISELDADSFFDYEEEEKYTCFVITTPLELKKYSMILLNNLILHDSQDISEKILNSEIDLELETEQKIDETNSFKYDFFIDDLNAWIYDNLEIDIVLDRITKVGINSLKEVEKNFLKYYTK